MSRAITVPVAFLVLALGPGCASETVAPATGPALRQTPGTAPPGVNGGTLLDPDLETFEEVTTETVRPGKQTVVQGSRYALRFMEGSLLKQTRITISERHPYIADVVLGPEGIHFPEPVYFTIDYAKTANDPSMPYWHGKAPQVFWWNGEKEAWVEVPGWDDPDKRTYTVLLFHFSRYAMRDGTGGWEGPARGGPRSGKSEIDTP